MKIPCGQVLGHGEYCTTGYLCGSCKTIIMIQDVVKLLNRMIDSGEAHTEVSRTLVRAALDPEKYYYDKLMKKIEEKL